MIENARRILVVRETHGSFATQLDAHHPRARPEWRKLFKRTFVLAGGEIVGEFLLSTGYPPGAHRAGCPVHERIVAAGPPWTRAVPAGAARANDG